MTRSVLDGARLTRLSGRPRSSKHSAVRTQPVGSHNTFHHVLIDLDTHRTNIEPPAVMIRDRVTVWLRRGDDKGREGDQQSEQSITQPNLGAHWDIKPTVAGLKNVGGAVHSPREVDRVDQPKRDPDRECRTKK